MHMKKQYYFAKSFEEDFVLKTLVNKKKKDFQSIQNVIKTKIIKPNTYSFGRKKRLACTFLHKNYLKTYRPQGLIFKTNSKPDCIYPFDLSLLAQTEDLVVRYHKIKDKLDVYYNHKLIPGFKAFVFKDIDGLLKKYPKSEKVWSSVNAFREKNNFKKLSQQKYKLIEYNEVIYNKPVEIIPVAIFGYSKESRKIAKELNLKHYINAKKFYEKNI